jgi:hypothetical protein
VIKKLEKLCRKGFLYNFGDCFAILYSLRLLIEGTPCIQSDLVMIGDANSLQNQSVRFFSRTHNVKVLPETTQNTESILTRQELLDETYLGSFTRVQSLSRPSNSLYRLQQSTLDIRRYYIRKVENAEHKSSAVPVSVCQ